MKSPGSSLSWLSMRPRSWVRTPSKNGVMIRTSCPLSNGDLSNQNDRRENICVSGVLLEVTGCPWGFSSSLELVTWEVPLGQQDGAFPSGALIMSPPSRAATPTRRDLTRRHQVRRPNWFSEQVTTKLRLGSSITGTL